MVSCVVERSSYRSIMLRQEELAFLKAMSTPAFPCNYQGAEAGYVVPKEDVATSGGARSPNDHLVSSQASAKPTR
jgi:hypothetical protein